MNKKLTFLIAFVVVAFAFADAYNPRGVVSPVIPCGGVGEGLELRVTDCTLTPCQFEPGKTYLVEGDFIPFHSCGGLGFKLFVLFNGTVHSLLDVPIPGSSVVGGEPYTIQYPLTPDNALSGESFDIIINVYCVESGTVELCVGAPATLA